MKVPKSVGLAAEMWEWVAEQAQQEGRSVSAWLEALIKDEQGRRSSLLPSSLLSSPPLQQRRKPEPKKIDPMPIELSECHGKPMVWVDGVRVCRGCRKAPEFK